MGNQYIVRGVDPISGQVTQVVVSADSAYEARRVAESSGLEDGLVLGSVSPEPVVHNRAMALL